MNLLTALKEGLGCARIKMKSQDEGFVLASDRDGKLEMLTFQHGDWYEAKDVDSIVLTSDEWETHPAEVRMGPKILDDSNLVLAAINLLDVFKDGINSRYTRGDFDKAMARLHHEVIVAELGDEFNPAYIDALHQQSDLFERSHNHE